MCKVVGMRREICCLALGFWVNRGIQSRLKLLWQREVATFSCSLECCLPSATAVLHLINSLHFPQNVPWEGK